MQVKDKFLEKINLIIFVFILCFCNYLYAQNIHDKLFNYNQTLKNSSAKFIQTSTNYIQEGKIYFGNKRIKIEYKKPENLTIVLAEKKGMYINHDLKETEFFLTNKSYIKVFFEIFHKKDQIKNMTVKGSDYQLEISKTVKLDNLLSKIKLVYENDPIKLRRLEINGDNDKIQMGFFEHKKEEIFDKKFFSMINPYLN